MRPAFTCGEAFRKPKDLLDFVVDALLRPAFRCGDAVRKPYDFLNFAVDALLTQRQESWVALEWVALNHA